MTRICTRLAVVAMIGFGASACSSIPDWVDPTNWIGGPSDTEASPGETPDLATLPDRPTPTSTAEEQKQVAESLDADRTRAKYSADALRGGTEAEAAPPPPPSAASEQQIAAQTPAPAPVVAAASVPDTSDTVTVPQGDAAPAAPQPSAAPAPAPEAVSLPPAPAPALNTEAPAAANSAPPPAAQTYSAPAPVRAMAAATVDPSDAALGFRPSTAPPLDPSIGQFVPAPILARYEQTASGAGLPRSQIAMVAPAPALKKTARAKAVGGPDSMSGAVVANMDAMQSSAPQQQQPSVYANPLGLPPASVVFFPGDGTLLDAHARAQVHAAVETFKQSGAKGFIRVVGHSSSRTSNMPLEQHLVMIFNKSQDRANAVAKECIREGVPASRVLVEAVGDSQPVYYESMPKGEDGNRRAEIFLQS
jgi:outer membrane protein OmpA-like peptidoglycan-associated protein